ncbi:MAG TPA: ATP-binding protein [Sedimentisphaerales bacterium]|nr:ATP-binding protein [Sedimentisphaerales bacterium]
MKVSSKVVLGFIGIALLVAAVGSVAIKYNAMILLDVDRILLANSREAKAAGEVVYQIQKIESDLRDFLSGTPDWKPLREETARAGVTKSISSLRQFSVLWEDSVRLAVMLSKEKQARKIELDQFEGLKAKIDALMLLVNKTLALKEEKGLDTAEVLFQTEVQPLLLETNEMARRFQENKRQEVMTQTEQIRSAVRNNAWIAIIATIIGLIAVISVRYFVNRTFTRPVVELTNAAAEIGKGKFQTQLTVKSNDEIGALARSFNEMAEKLKQSYASLDERIQQRAAELSSANSKLGEEMGERSLAQEKLQQHVHQLNCLYELSDLLARPQTTLEQIFKAAPQLIRKAYQRQDATSVRITFDGIHYKTENFEKSELSQYAQIKLRGEKAGVIEVYYLGDKVEAGQGPFLKEEHDLLSAVAERLGSVAERKQAEDKLQLFRNLIDRSNDCIFVIEPKWGRLLDVNDRACDSLGYTRKELLDMTFKDIEQSIPDDAAWQQQTEELERKGDIIVEGRHKPRDGSAFFAETSLKLVTHEKENYIIAVARDVTERKQAEQRQAQLIRELKSTNKKVESINQELKDFAYIVSHDLKAPLRGIKTLTDWISSDYKDKLDKDGQEQMSLLSARVGRMHKLIDGILQYSRVGRVKEEVAQVNLSGLIPEIIDMVAPPDNISIEVEPELPVVEYEKTSIVQVFQNLLSNAVKYMDKPQGRIGIGCAEEGDFWKFSVADNGPGIEEKHFERIFRIFQTLAPRDQFESTGIGLTVIKKIIELHGGKIWVESEVGQGSTFFFTLPKSGKEVENAELEANIAC